MREKTIENYLVKRVKECGGWAIKFVPTFVSGFPDRICLFPGAIILFIELKAPGKTPRKLQIVIHKKLMALGFTVLVLDSKESIDETLSDYGF